ncbi:MAG TPA: amidohydrolase family protein [Steroidobacteraceae bacterium]|nr:amidohydrolase family protein [Steroidobacteraceae bacterium]
MSLRSVDLAIEARWVLPLVPAATSTVTATATATAAAAAAAGILEHHTLIVHEGRIVELLSSTLARTRYEPLALIERPTHLLMPGLVNARVSTDVGAVLEAPAGAPPRRPAGGVIGMTGAAGAVGAAGASAGASAAGAAAAPADTALLTVAQLLSSGVTCCAHVGARAGEFAQVALEQGLRLCLGLPLAGTPASLSEALRLHDEYRAHPTVNTLFALPDVNWLEDAMLERIATLSVEIDSGVLAPVHASAASIERSIERHGVRPIVRLERAGLLTPALAAAHMRYLTVEEVALAARCGIGVTLCPLSDLAAGQAPPLGLLNSAGVPLSAGSGESLEGGDCGLWSDLKLLLLASRGALEPAEVLAIACQGGARVLGLADSIGSLEPGRWADLLCLDRSRPGARGSSDTLRSLVLGAGRDLVSDVWVAGRQLICEGAFTRLDWPRLAARLDAGRATGNAWGGLR